MPKAHNHREKPERKNNRASAAERPCTRPGVRECADDDEGNEVDSRRQVEANLNESARAAIKGIRTAAEASRTVGRMREAWTCAASDGMLFESRETVSRKRGKEGLLQLIRHFPAPIRHGRARYGANTVSL